MLYVQQSLGPKEEILLGARFHWMYTAQAVMWIIMGMSFAGAVAYGCVWWEINEAVKEAYGTTDFSAAKYAMAESIVVEKKGGYLKILWEINPALRASILVMFVLGLFLFANMMIVKATTEIAITTDRLIYKKGMIARHVGELSVDRIEGVSVVQGVLARLLGYGSVSIRGMGVGEVVLPPIEAPIEFRRAVQEAKQMQETGTSLNDGYL